VQGVTSATEKQMAGLDATVRKLGATTSFTTTEVGSAAVELARGGQSVERIGKTLPAVLNLARGTGSDLAFSAQTVVRTLGQFQLDVEESGRVVDVLAASANAGTLDLQDLGEAMKYLGPIMKTVNGSVEDAGAAFAVMANNGLRGGLAGRQLRRVLYELADPLKRVRIANELGVQVVNAEGDLRPLADLVEEIGKGLDKLSNAKKVSFLDDVFGEGASAFEALSAGSKELRQITGDILVADGYAQSLADTIDGGLGGAFRIALSAIQDLGIEVGKQLEGTLTAFFRLIQVGAQDMTEFVKQNGEAIKTLLRLSVAATAFGVSFLAIGRVVTVIGAIVSALRTLRTAMIATGAIGAALATGGAGLVTFLATVTAAAGAAYAADLSFQAMLDSVEEVGTESGKTGS
jgi:TP901 family phage tail tape measure protein